MVKVIDPMEKVQRQSKTDLPFETQFERLGLYSLYCKWQRGDLIVTYKLLNGYYSIYPTIFFTMSNVYTTRGHHCKLFKF